MQGQTDVNIQLPAVLDLAASELFLDAMRHAPMMEPVKLDASGVDVLTLPCMQIILAALRANPAMTIEQPSEAFTQAFADLAFEWRQEGSEAGEPAPPPKAALSPEEEAEAAFFAAAQQYQDVNAEPSASPDLDIGNEANIPPDSVVEASAAEAATTECAGGAAPAHQTDEACMTKRILTIDDSRTIRDMLNLTLSEAGFEVLQAIDGEDGIDVLEKQERVDLVITDINMPKMDGYGVIRHIRQQSKYNGMPVLVLTTESEKGKRNIAKEAGATGWMVKPFDPERLIATINKVSP